MTSIEWNWEMEMKRERQRECERERESKRERMKSEMYTVQTRNTQTHVASFYQSSVHEQQMHTLVLYIIHFKFNVRYCILKIDHSKKNESSKDEE